jgi:hypothetical protein
MRPGTSDHARLVATFCVLLAFYILKIEIIRGAGRPYGTEIGFYHRKV